MAQSLRPFPQFGTITASHAPLGGNWYNALQAKATKRTSRGLNFTVSFAYAEELSTAGPVNDVFNRLGPRFRVQDEVLDGGGQHERLRVGVKVPQGLAGQFGGSALYYSRFSAGSPYFAAAGCAFWVGTERNVTL